MLYTHELITITLTINNIDDDYKEELLILLGTTHLTQIHDNNCSPFPLLLLSGLTPEIGVEEVEKKGETNEKEENR